MDPKPAERPRSAYAYIMGGAALLVFIETFSLLSPILLSFLLILLISLAINPVISRMKAWAGGRKGAAVLFVAAVVAVIALTGWAFFGPMKVSLVKLSEQVPAYWDRLQKPLIKMEHRAVLSEAKLQEEVTIEIEQNAAAGKAAPARHISDTTPLKAAKESGAIRSSLSEMFRSGVVRLTAGAFNAAQILVVLTTVFFGVTFTLMNPRPIFWAIFSLVPERHHDEALTILQRIGKFVPGWAGAVLLGMLTIGLLVFLTMWPFFGFSDALVLGLIACILEAVPFLGPMLSAVPALLLAVAKGGMTPLWVLLAYLAVQAVENNVTLPFIFSRSMKLHPVALIFSMLLCVAAFGVLGVLVAAPLVAIVKIVHDELYRKRYLPTVTDADLDRLARNALHEKKSVP